MDNSKRVWFSAVAIAVAVVVFMFYLADPADILSAMSQASLPLLALALVPLAIEAGFASLRIQHCVNHPVAFSKAMYCTSIYIAWLGILPARLGEVAGIAVFSSKLEMPVGSAIASVVVQRIYDVLILCGLLIALLTQTVYGGTTGLVIASLVVIGLIAVLLTLPFWLDLSARILFPWRRKKWLKVLLSVALQARTWYRHQSQRDAVLWLAGSTLCKWLFNISAMTLIFSACQIEITPALLALIAILMHFFGAIPIQSFGGFGAAEVGLTAILVSQGIPADQAIATSFVVRFVSLTFGGLFFAFSFLLLRPRL